MDDEEFYMDQEFCGGGCGGPAGDDGYCSEECKRRSSIAADEAGDNRVIEQGC